MAVLYIATPLVPANTTISLSQIDVVIFDLDGTLIDSSQDIAEGVNVALQTIGLPTRTVEDIKLFIGNGTKALIRKILSNRMDLFEPAFQTFTNYYQAHLLDHTRLYPGAKDALEKLSEKKLAVLSNKRQRFCDPIIDGLKLRDRFGMVLGGDALAHSKPHPEPIFHILDRFQGRPERTLMVGDSSIDVLAGKAAGTGTVGLTDGFCMPPEVENTSPDWLFRNLSEFSSSLQI